MEALLVVLALALGLAVGWLVARTRAGREVAAVSGALGTTKEELAKLRAQLDERERALAEQKGFLAQAAKQTEDAFARLSQQALERNAAAVLASTDARLKPLGETLQKLEARANELEATRAKAYGNLETHLASLKSATEGLKSSSESLASALRGSTVARGRWGELQLRNLVDAAGMTPHVDFLEQTAAESGSRPDMQIRLPEGDSIPVDAKVPLSAYLAASEARDPDERKKQLKLHAELLRRHVRELSKRDYARSGTGRIDFTVLFLASDAILGAALEQAPDALEEAIRARVLIATPVTLFGLLRMTQVLWNQQAVAENALEIHKHASEFHKRAVTFQAHFIGMREGLQKAVKSYNDALGSFQSRVVPAGRKLEELGGAADARERLVDVELLDTELREPQG